MCLSIYLCRSDTCWLQVRGFPPSDAICPSLPPCSPYPIPSVCHIALCMRLSHLSIYLSFFLPISLSLSLPPSLGIYLPPTPRQLPSISPASDPLPHQLLSIPTPNPPSPPTPTPSPCFFWLFACVSVHLSTYLRNHLPIYLPTYYLLA